MKILIIILGCIFGSIINEVMPKNYKYIWRFFSSYNYTSNINKLIEE